MKVLMLAHVPVFPPNDGGSARIHEFAANLAREHQVIVVCPPLAQRPREALPYTLLDIGGAGARRQIFDPGFLMRLLRLIRREQPDVLLLEYIWQALHATAARLITGVPLVIDAFDVVTVRFRRARHPLWPVISLYERLMLRGARRVFAISEVDRREFVRLGVAAERLAVVPGGVDVAIFHPDDIARQRTRIRLGVPEDRPLLLFFGQLTYPPNADAIDLLASEVMPRLDMDYHLAVAGRGPIEELRQRYGSDRISFLGPVERISDYINAADAVVAPIRHGSGTRRKLLETIACGVPVVTTTIGAEGLDERVCAGSVTIRDDWDQFAEAVRGAAAARRLRPREEFLAMHDWRSVIQKVQL
jgi:glycosyltransferase involved in cell wall biosynthesis